MNKSCSIFFYEGWLNISPTLINLASLLAKSGYEVIIYTRDTGYDKPTHLSPRIEVVYLREHIEFEKLLQLFPNVKLGFLAPTLLLVLFAFQILIYRLKHHSTKAARSISIGVDTNCAILALLESYFTKSTLVYLSLELNYEKYSFYFYKWRAILGRLAYRRSACVLIQDEDRFKILCESARYEHDRVFYIPNSISSDSLDTQSNLPENTNFFQEKFSLEKSKYPYLVVQAGIIDDVVFSGELASAFDAIDKDFALIFHAGKQRDWNDPYIKLLREVNSTNLYLSLDPLPYEQIDRVFRAVTIGLAFYRGVDDNFSKIAKASGKLSGYLKYGKPVLMSDLQSLSELNERYQFGIVIKNPSSSAEIEQALDRIMSNYNFYSSNAILCYEREFDFDACSKSFLEFIVNRSNSNVLSDLPHE